MDVDLCVPDWAKDGGSCPHGVLINVPGAQFTWPNQPTVLDGIAAFFSAMPFIITVGLICSLVYRRTVREVYILILSPIIIGPVMAVLKFIISEIRPVGSCSTSCGMPSGHSMQSIGIYVFLLCELISRGMTSPYLIAVITLILVPVTWSRVQLRDHSLAQVAVGSAIGSLVAGVYFVCLRSAAAAGKTEAFAELLRLQDDYTPKESTKRSVSESTPLESADGVEEDM
jgi:dolichyldiphosphatase